MRFKKLPTIFFATFFIFIFEQPLLWSQAPIQDIIIINQPSNISYIVSIDTRFIITSTGNLNTGGYSIMMNNNSGEVLIEKGGILSGTSAAISAVLQNTPSNPQKSILVENAGTLMGGIANFNSKTGTIFTLNNYGDYRGDYRGGAGNDNLYIYEGSTLTGALNIDLAAGNNHILLGKDIILRGNLTSASGATEGTTFVFESGSEINGTFDSGISANNILRLSPNDAKGGGIAIGGVVAYTGKLETTILKEAGTTNIYNSSISSAVGGSLDLNEIRINPQNGTGAFGRGDTFQIAGGMLSMTGSPNIIAPGEMLTFGLDGSTGIQVIDRENFSDYATGSATRQLAQYVDTVLDNHGVLPTRIDHVFSELQFGTKAQTSKFFQGNDPSGNLAFAGASFRTTQFITQGLTDRMELLRNRRSYAQPQDTETAVFRGQNECPIGTGCNHRDRDLFVRGFGAYHKEDATSDLLGYNATSSGVQLGYDWRVTNRSYFGLSAAFANIDIDITDANHSGKDFMLRFGGYYTRKLANGGFFDAEISYGNHDSDYDRYYTTGLGWRDVHADFRAQDVSVYLGIGKKITCQSGFYYKPYAAVQYIYYRQPGYEEQGNYGLYQFASEDMSSFVTRFALKFGREQFRCNRYLGYELETGYNLELADNARISGGWIGGQNDLFTLSRGNGFENSFYGSAKLHLRPTDHVELFSRYLAEGSKGGFLHGLELGGQWRF